MDVIYKPSRSRSELVIEMIADAVFLAWWVGLIRFRDFLPFQDVITFELAPFWKSVFWAVLAWVASELAIATLELAFPRMVRVLSGLKLIRYVGGVMLAGLVLRADLLVQVTSTVFPPGFTSNLEALVNTGGKIGYLVLLISLGFKAAVCAVRLVRGAEPPSVSPA
jgi:hypothetical protein